MGNVWSGEMVPQDTKSWNPHPKAYKPGPYTVERPGATAKDGETVPRVNWRAKDGLINVPEPGVETLWDVVRRAAEKFGNAKAVGYRKQIKIHEETKQIKKQVDGQEVTQDKKWSYFELSEYHYMSFTEYEKMALRVGAGLRELGLNAGDRVHIFAATR